LDGSLGEAPTQNPPCYRGPSPMETPGAWLIVSAMPTLPTCPASLDLSS
jgi:hypothetical protein